MNMNPPEETALPLSAAQEAMWVAQQLDPENPCFNSAEYVEISGPLNRDAFERAVRRTIGDADALHTRYFREAGVLRQVINPTPTWPLHVVDVRSAPDPRAAAEAWMRADRGVRVDLATGPLFTQALFLVEPDRHFWYQRIHHIAIDGFGFSLLTRRAASVYSSLVAGEPVSERGFDPLSMVVDNDIAYRKSESYPLDAEFWRQRLADRPDPVSLTERVALPSDSFLHRDTTLDRSIVGSWRAVARAAGADWWDLLVAGIVAYLHQFTGATDLTVGVLVMGRLGTGSRRVPAVVTNIAPLRVRIEPAMRFTDLIAAVHRESREIAPHQRYRHERIRRDLKLVGGRRRLFGPVVNILPFGESLSFGGCRGVTHNITAVPVEDLIIGLWPDSAGPRIDFDANPAVYRDDEVATHQKGLLALLDRVVTSPEQVIRREPLVRVLDGPPLAEPARPVVDLIRERASTQPDVTAVECDGDRLSYRELVDAAEGLARRLRQHGAGPDAPVGVLLGPGTDAIVAFLGALFAGAGFLPLAPDWPASRLAAVLGDAGPTLLVTTARHAGRLHGVADTTTRLLLGADEDDTDEDTDAPLPEADERNPAYLIYTSGSTGAPKGVVVSRGALAHFVAGAGARFRFGAEDRLLQTFALIFDASTVTIFVTLCSGATLVQATEHTLSSVRALVGDCTGQQVSALAAPTAVWHELTYALSSGTETLPSKLNTVIIAGEAAMIERVRQWRAAVGRSVRLFNQYGPTETVGVTIADLHSDIDDREVPIGPPLPGVRAAVVHDADPHVGELYLIGGTLATGYLGRPDLTALRFAPLTALPDRPRAYRSGDLVRVRADGQLVFVGRVDHELKISGYRVDPTEVESALLRHPGIREAAVVAQELPTGSKRLVAHVVADGEPPPAAGVRAHVAALLPAAIVPGVVTFTDRLPRTGNGKIDRNALRATDPDPEPGAGAGPRTETEAAVRRVWSAVLGTTEPAGDFFELGGGSLQTIQAANRLSTELGRDVPVAMIFNHPTPTELAAALDRPREVTHAPALPAQASADAVLAPDVTYPASTAHSGRHVLLTGATGFVGTHLLHELLTTTDARVVCPVRAADAGHAAARVREALAAQGLPEPGEPDRVHAVPADLSRPRLGLPPDVLAEIVPDCSAIYHNAAAVSLARSYRSLRAVNVLATEQLLRLSSANGAIPVHYVSTLGVAPPRTVAPEVLEDFLPPHEGLRIGYQQTKWVSERLVQQAVERGLPARVYRLGRVVGPLDTSWVNPRDLVWRLLLPAIRAGVEPPLDVCEVWTPVDWVTAAIVRLAATPLDGPVTNLAPVPPTSLTDVLAWAGEYGYALRRESAAEWFARLRSSADEEDMATLAFFDLQAGWRVAEHAADLDLGNVRCDNLVRGLDGSGVVFPRVGRAEIHRYLDTCVARGLLPAPDRVSATR